MQECARWHERQVDVARALGISRAHVCLVFNGRRLPRLDMAARIAECLGMSLDEFYKRLRKVRAQAQAA